MTSEQKPKKSFSTKGLKWTQTDYNWPEIETGYVYGWVDPETGHHKFPSLDELMVKMGYDPSNASVVSSFRNNSSRGGWRLKREEYRAQLEQARRVEMLRKMSTRQVSFDDECWKIAETGLNHIKTHFNRYAKEQQPVPPQDLERLARSFQKFQLAGRLALGDTVGDLREKLDGGNVDWEQLTKEELKQLNEMLSKAGGKDLGQ